MVGMLPMNFSLEVGGEDIAHLQAFPVKGLGLTLDHSLKVTP